MTKLVDIAWNHIWSRVKISMETTLAVVAVFLLIATVPLWGPFYLFGALAE